ncbi:uncharacterized protein LOC143655627 isoform X1 [Tamandua tetradactyla]|uniref:uncharacterized protein LOC143655627 isoform X1 n=1 Tax=Tamandua tetradactyla TaxID=48850 RepID=UPI0040539BAD
MTSSNHRGGKYGRGKTLDAVPPPKREWEHLVEGECRGARGFSRPHCPLLGREPQARAAHHRAPASRGQPQLLRPLALPGTAAARGRRKRAPRPARGEDAAGRAGKGAAAGAPESCRAPPEDAVRVVPGCALPLRLPSDGAQGSTVFLCSAR